MSTSRTTAAGLAFEFAAIMVLLAKCHAAIPESNSRKLMLPTSNATTASSSTNSAVAAPPTVLTDAPIRGPGVAAPGGPCGPKNGGDVCPPGQCCSATGYCGVTYKHCGAGCQVQYGSCGSAGVTQTDSQRQPAGGGGRQPTAPSAPTSPSTAGGR